MKSESLLKGRMAETLVEELLKQSGILFKRDSIGGRFSNPPQISKKSKLQLAIAADLDSLSQSVLQQAFRLR